MVDNRSVVDLTNMLNPSDEAEGEPPLTDAAGNPHYFRTRDSMSLMERAQLDRWVKEHDQLAGKNRPDARDEEKHRQIACDVLAYVLPSCDRRVFEDDLNVGQRTALLIAFLIDSGMASSVAKVIQNRRLTIGALLSPDSNVSTP